VPQSKEYMSFRQSLGRFLKEVLGTSAQVHETCADIDVIGEKDKVQRAISPIFLCVTRSANWDRGISPVNE
jgi:hypothetical protein